MSNIVATLWEDAVIAVRETCAAPAVFDSLTRDARVLEASGGTLRVALASPFALHCVQREYQPLLEEALAKGEAGPVRLDLTLAEPIPGVSEGETSTAQAVARIGGTENCPAPAMGKAPARQAFSLAEFVWGDNNRLARAAVETLARGEHIATSVLLHGGHGAGKTHLARATASAARQAGLSVVLTTAKQFVFEVGRAHLDQSTETLRRRYREAQAVIIDDFHALAEGNKAGSQAELTALLDIWAQAGTAVLLLSRATPEGLESLHEALRSRLSAGLAVELAPLEAAGRETLCAVLASRAGVALGPKHIELICQSCADARAMQGVLAKIKLWGAAHGCTPSPAELAPILPRPLPTPVHAEVPTSQGVIEASAAVFGLRPEDLTGTKRAKAIVAARRVAMLLARHTTRESLHAIGMAFGQRTHSTVLSNIKTALHEAQADETIARRIEAILFRLGRAANCAELLKHQGELF